MMAIACQQAQLPEVEAVELPNQTNVNEKAKGGV